MNPLAACRHLLCLSFLCVQLTSCASRSHAPDLERLYMQARDVAQPPVVVIHGILGARLADQDTGEEAWFGSLWRLATHDYAELALDIDPESLSPRPDRLVPTGLTEQAAGRDFYGRILRVLEEAGGYVRATAGSAVPAGQRSYYVYAYDWRQDNVESARGLSRLIEQIRADHGDPALRVDLLAHSMGGLIARYYLRYGETDVTDNNDFPVNLHGADRVRRVVLLGTPNLGSVSSLHAFIEGYRVGLSRLPTEALATMPSTYQLFPHALNEWLVDAAGHPLRRDLFDVEFWRRLQWSIFDPEVAERVRKQHGAEYLDTLQRYFHRHLERARRFVWSLTVPLPEQPWRLIVFGGVCQLTPARLVVEDVDGESMVRLWPGQVRFPVDGVDYGMLMLEPGDGTVTKASLLARESLDPSVPRHQWVNFPIAYPQFLCEEHDMLTGNITFQDNLLHALLSLDAGT